MQEQLLIKVQGNKVCKTIIHNLKGYGYHFPLFIQIQTFKEKKHFCV